MTVRPRSDGPQLRAVEDPWGAPPASAPAPTPRRDERRFDWLLPAARAGDEQALTTLYRELHPALVRYLRVHAAGEEEDLAAEVWIDLARALQSFQGGEDGFRRLAFTIARRRAIDAGRKRGRRRTDPTDLGSLLGLAHRDDTEAIALDRIASDEAVERILSRLSPAHAEVVLLRVVAGMSVAEVAELLGRRPGAISLVQHRALRRLARDLVRGRRGGSDET